MRPETRLGLLAFAACAVVALVVIGIIRGLDAGGDPVRGIVVRLGVEPATEATMTRALDLVQTRVDERGLGGITISRRGDEIAVELTKDSADEELADHLTKLILRTATVDFIVVDHRQEFTAQFVRQDPDAAAAGITIEEDSWTASDGYHRNELVCATDRGRLGAYVTRLDVPLGHRFAFQRVPRPDGDLWRAFVLDTSRKLPGRSIADAIQTYDDQARPLVVVEFSDPSALESLTRAKVGHQLAVVLDDRILHTLVIVEPIRTGELRLSVAADADAVDLVTAIRAGWLPATLHLKRTQQFSRPRTTFLGAAWPFLAAALALALATIAVVVVPRARRARDKRRSTRS